MTNDTEMTQEQALKVMRDVASAHVSVSRGALPVVVPSRIHLSTDNDVLLDVVHATVVRGAERGDIAAVQVDGVGASGEHVSITATGPLSVIDGLPGLQHDHLLVSVECIDSTHGDVIDPLLRSQLVHAK